MIKETHILEEDVPLLQIQKSTGLYHYHDREEEDSGWDLMSHYFYLSNGRVVWSIDYDHRSNFFFINKEQKSPLSECNRESFIDFVIKNSPNSSEWVLFNIEKLFPSKPHEP